MTTYYFRSHNGERIEAASIQAISRLAQREADKFGTSVQIYTGASRKSHRKMSMARNPKTRSHKTRYYEDTLNENTKKKYYALKWVPETPYAKAHWTFDGYDGNMHFADQPIKNIDAHLAKDGYVLFGGHRFKRNPIIEEYTDHMARMKKYRPVSIAEQRQRSSKLAGKKSPWYVRAVKGGKVATHKLMSKAQAQQVADAYRAQGHAVEVMRRNPATRASKARKSAAHKRGCYVEWSYGSGTPKERIKCGNRGIATIRANELKRSGAKGVKIVQA